MLSSANNLFGLPQLKGADPSGQNRQKNSLKEPPRFW